MALRHHCELARLRRTMLRKPSFRNSLCTANGRDSCRCFAKSKPLVHLTSSQTRILLKHFCFATPRTLHGARTSKTQPDGVIYAFASSLRMGRTEKHELPLRRPSSRADGLSDLDNERCGKQRFLRESQRTTARRPVPETPRVASIRNLK